jgi:GH35 family endo-1,4-beta-xylanase
MHVDSEKGNPNYLAIARNFERFRKLGLLIYITEMDVTSDSTKDPKVCPINCTGTCWSLSRSGF